MIRKAIFPICVLALALLLGCSQKEESQGETPDDLDTPQKTVEHLFNAIRGDKGINTASLFSSAVPVGLVSGYVEKFRAGKEVTMYNLTGVKEQEETAKVTVKYFFYEKQVGGDEVKLSSKQIGELNLTLNLEDGNWLIRFTGDELDVRVEEKVFYDCLNAVMDAAIAQELYYGPAGAYTPVIAELEDVMPVNPGRCHEFKIESADEYDFRITATTLNREGCRLIATSEAVIPTKYSECSARAAAE
ncbi:MAG: hypothetical protein ABIH66_08355 [bacterium]